MNKQIAKRTLLISIIFAVASICIIALIGGISKYKSNKKTYAVVTTFDEFKRRVVKNGEFSFDEYLEVAEEWANDEDTFLQLISSDEWKQIIDLLENSTTFTIASYDALVLFADDVNGGNNYAGKVVKLKSEINCGGKTVGIGSGETNISEEKEGCYFKGEFDGCGYTIRSVNYGSNYLNYGGGHSVYSYSLFTACGGTIKNLRVANASCTLSESGRDKSRWAGGIVGFSNNATITNCIVENFNVTTSGSETEKMGATGVFASGRAQVSNCYISNIKVNGNIALISGIGPRSNYGSLGSTIFSTENSKIQKCVVRHATKGDNVSYLYDYYFNGENVNVTVENCYSSNTGDSFVKLGTNLSQGGSSSNAWYYISSYNYNGGWPYLRTFISWQTIQFMEGSNCSPSPSSVKIPTGIDASILDNTSSLSFYEQSVNPGVGECYTFTGWSYEDLPDGAQYDGVYHVETTRRTLNIQFKSATNITATCGADTSLNTDYNLGCGGYVYVTYGTRFLKEGYQSITIYFTDMNNVRRSVTYTADSKYVIEKADFVSAETGYKVLHAHGAEVISSVSVIIKEKSYNATFQ